jgi:uncharacterized protein (DUF4415 family)
MTGTDKPLGMKQQAHHYYLLDAMRRFEWDMHDRIWMNQRIPDEWHQIAGRREVAKERVTLRLDADVVKWFKSMGPGYGPRMNDVLQSFMHARLAGLLKGDETIEPFKESGWSTMEMPTWGVTEREVEGRKKR